MCNTCSTSCSAMFEIRSRSSATIEKRQRSRKVFDVKITNAKLPLIPAVDWSQRWCTLPVASSEALNDLYDFEVQADDVYVVTFPKCGTTWLQEATWLLVNNLDFSKANSVNLGQRSPFMDLSIMYNSLNRNTVEVARNAPSPRILKTHLPAQLLPRQIWEKRAKVIYCGRNPKDTVVSFYHFHHGLGTWDGTIEDYVEDFMNDDIMYTPYWDNLMPFWQMRNEDHVFFTTFEEMKRDLRGVLINLSRFLETPQLSDEILEKLEHHLSFDRMKANLRTNPTLAIRSNLVCSTCVNSNFEFMRRGVVGSFKDELSQETQEKLDKWIEANLAHYNIKLEDIFGNL